ncbi:hypothetical protein F511_45303 [Dorcoceras hygrometricum]|uniref:Uncharacterized protein n=1 Tax=Dorcoceras hygrometricum TaxID=472368 RepID=A0A2Z7A3J9_9LAMI|nr:hypothetical protein F511_45303 [Dorcoceras hygrometricum]
MRTTATPPPQAAAPLPPIARACRAMRAGRASAARWPHDGRAAVARSCALVAHHGGRLASSNGRHFPQPLRDVAGHCCNAGRLFRALVLRCRAARGAAVRRAMAHDGRWLRALPPRDIVVAAPSAGRRSGEAPAMS